MLTGHLMGVRNGDVLFPDTNLESGTITIISFIFRLHLAEVLVVA
jgi:hypothetical protein